MTTYNGVTMERPIAYDKLAREERFVRMRARDVAERRVEQGLPTFPGLATRESIRERVHGILVGELAVDFVLADEITHVRMGSRWLNELTRGDPERRRRAIEFQDTLDERFNLGGVRQDGEPDEVGISIAKDARRLAGFTDDEIERLVRSTQRSPVY